MERPLRIIGSRIIVSLNVNRSFVVENPFCAARGMVLAIGEAFRPAAWAVDPNPLAAPQPSIHVGDLVYFKITDAVDFSYVGVNSPGENLYVVDQSNVLAIDTSHPTSLGRETK